jgi:hypothetical protein
MVHPYNTCSGHTLVQTPCHPFGVDVGLPAMFAERADATFGVVYPRTRPRAPALSPVRLPSHPPLNRCLQPAGHGKRGRSPPVRAACNMRHSSVGARGQQRVLRALVDRWQWMSCRRRPTCHGVWNAAGRHVPPSWPARPQRCVVCTGAKHARQLQVRQVRGRP